MFDINEKFKDVRETEYRKLSKVDPVLIVLDGKNVTKHHDRYPLLKENTFTEVIFTIGKEIVKDLNLNAHIYAMTDEINFIFTESDEFIKFFKVDGSAEYILSLFLQRFLKRFWSYYPEVFLKASISNVTKDKIARYIQFRKEICYDNALFYIAKEFLSSKEYYGKSTKEVEDLLKGKKLFYLINDYPVLSKGLEWSFNSEKKSQFLNISNWVRNF